MANLVLNIAKGRLVEKAMLPLGTDNLLVVLLQSAGLGTDATLQDVDTLAAVLANGTEATFTNYARKVLTAGDITVTVNDTTNVVTLDIADQVWTAAGGATNNTLGALIVAYRPTSGSADSAILPLTKHDFSATTTGGNLTAQIAATGIATAA